MRNMTIGRYQLSIALLLAIILIVPVTVIATTYLWATRTVPFSVQEPLSITSSLTSFTSNPGENRTLDITIQNTASVEYLVTLTFRLNDTTYQESNVQFSNYTYNVTSGTNPIQAWFKVDRKAPAAALELTIEFNRE